MKQICLTLFFFTCCIICYGQLQNREKQFVLEHQFHDHTFDPRKPSFMTVGNNPVVKYNPVSLTLGGLLYIYQKIISPQLQSHCPYEISCSAFSKASIQEFGLIKGVALTADRLTRCTQFTLIDILPSQINDKTGSIKDDVLKYRVRHEH